MKQASSYDLNRSIHIGRRDAFFDKTSEIFQKSLKEAPEPRRLHQIESALYYLQAVLEHSGLAVKSVKSLPEEEAFLLIIRPLVFYLRSILAVSENELQLKNKESSLNRFLYGPRKRRPAKDDIFSSMRLLEDIAQFFKTIEPSYSRLKKDILANMNDSEKTRYHNAYQNISEHISTRRHQRHAVRYVRTYDPVLLEKYESV